MLKEAEEVSKDEEVSAPSTPVVVPRKKAKTKIGSSLKYKRKKKTAGKGKDGEDYEVKILLNV